MTELNPDIDRVLFSEEEIAGQVQAIADRINKDYAGKSLVLVVTHALQAQFYDYSLFQQGILKGSFIFMADLVRRITIPHRCEFMGTVLFLYFQTWFLTRPFLPQHCRHTQEQRTRMVL